MNDLTTAVDDRRMWTVKDCMKYLKCSRNKFKAFAAEYEIPVCGYNGRCYRYDPDDITNAVKRSKQPPTAIGNTIKTESIKAKAAEILRGE